MDFIVHSFIIGIISSFKCSMGLMMTFGSFGMLHCKTDSACIVVCTLISVCLWVCKSYMTILPVFISRLAYSAILSQMTHYFLFVTQYCVCLSVRLGQFKY